MVPDHKLRENDHVSVPHHAFQCKENFIYGPSREHTITQPTLALPHAQRCDILYASALGGLLQKPSFHRTASSL